MEWQPIESAPKDGPYLLWGRITGDTFDGDYDEPEPWTYHLGPVCGGADAVGSFLGDTGAAYGEGIERGIATHWMPLPAPPNTA